MLLEQKLKENTSLILSNPTYAQILFITKELDLNMESVEDKLLELYGRTHFNTPDSHCIITKKELLVHLPNRSSNVFDMSWVSITEKEATLYKHKDAFLHSSIIFEELKNPIPFKQLFIGFDKILSSLRADLTNLNIDLQSTRTNQKNRTKKIKKINKVDNLISLISGGPIFRLRKDQSLTDLIKILDTSMVIKYAN